MPQKLSTNLIGWSATAILKIYSMVNRMTVIASVILSTFTAEELRFGIVLTGKACQRNNDQ